jgi:plastocyanin
MRRRQGPGMLAIAAAAGALAALATLLPAGADAKDPARVQIVEKEYPLTLSRLRVPAGQAIVQLVNLGMDNHDVMIQSTAKGSKPIHFDQLSPGTHSIRTIKLVRGHYTLWCSLPQHRQLGMSATLVVS